MLTRCWKFGRRQKIDSEFLQVKEEGVVRVWISVGLNCNYVITDSWLETDNFVW